MKRFLAVLHARNIEFWRDRSSLAWNLAFPAMLLFGFAFMFADGNKPEYKVGILAQGTGVETDMSPFFALKHIEFVSYGDPELLAQKVDQHQLDLGVDLSSSRYWVNDSSSKGYLVSQLLLAHHPELTASTISGRPIRYVDWVLPGVLGMNLMFSSLFGVGYVIVRYRKNGVLKRLRATPLTAMEFLSAQIASRLVILLLVNVVLFIGCHQLLDFYILGSLLDLLVVFFFGAISLISLGLLVASRSASEEFTGGLLNFATWPMMFLSGVWFSLEGTPDIVRSVAQFLPLTHLVDGARAILTEGANLYDIRFNLLSLLFMTVLFLGLSTRLFNWEAEY